MFESRDSKVFVVAAAALAFAAGCSLTANLIMERRGFDRYQAMEQQAGAKADQDAAFVDEADSVTSDSSQDPYPQLAAQVTAMKRYAAQMRDDQRNIDALKVRFDAFSAGRAEITSDNAPDWSKLQDFRGQFRAIAQVMESDIAAFNQAADTFGSLTRQYWVEKVYPADLAQDMQDFRDKSHDALESMRVRLDSDDRSFDAQQASGGFDGLRFKKDLLDRMHENFGRLRDVRDSINEAAGELSSSSLGSTAIWGGPGMPDYSNSILWRFRSGSDKFWKIRDDFSALGDKFEASSQGQDQGQWQGAGPGSQGQWQGQVQPQGQSGASWQGQVQPQYQQGSSYQQGSNPGLIPNAGRNSGGGNAGASNAGGANGSPSHNVAPTPNATANVSAPPGKGSGSQGIGKPGSPGAAKSAPVKGQTTKKPQGSSQGHGHGVSKTAATGPGQGH